jgi:hypothetical protein
LRGDHEGSEKYKTLWIRKNLKTQPKNIYITPNKAKYAKQPDGTPNILIDDRGSNITAWEAKGGVGIKYQADEDGLDVVLKGFKRAVDIVKGLQKHEPQKLQSLDRGKMIAVQKSGDEDEEKLKEFISVFGQEISPDVINKIAARRGIDPEDVIKHGKTLYDIATTKIPGTNFSVADAIDKGLDVASVIPAVKRGTSIAQKVTKIGKRQAAKKAVKDIAKDAVKIDLPFGKSSSSSSSPEPQKKRVTLKTGDIISVAIDGKKFKLPITGILPSGYLVDISSVPGKRPGEKMTVPSQINETATEGSISAGNIASTGNSPHIAGGSPAVLRRWSGKPGSSGTSGKSIKHKPVKSQTAKDNPVTNPTVGNNLIA